MSYFTCLCIYKCACVYIMHVRLMSRFRYITFPSGSRKDAVCIHVPVCTSVQVRVHLHMCNKWPPPQGCQDIFLIDNPADSPQAPVCRCTGIWSRLCSVRSNVAHMPGVWEYPQASLHVNQGGHVFTPHNPYSAPILVHASYNFTF